MVMIVKVKKQGDFYVRKLNAELLIVCPKSVAFCGVSASHVGAYMNIGSYVQRLKTELFRRININPLADIDFRATIALYYNCTTLWRFPLYFTLEVSIL